MSANSDLSSFKQTESITRSFTTTIIAISVSFIFVLFGFYLSSRALLEGLNKIHQTNQLYDLTRKMDQLLNSYGETIDKFAQDKDQKQALAVFGAISEQKYRLFDAAKTLKSFDEEFSTQLDEIERAMREYRLSATRLFSGQSDSKTEILIISQFRSEAKDLLAKIQIDLTAGSNKTFVDVFNLRFQPLYAGIILTFVFTFFSMYLGLRLRQRFHRALKNLTNATRQVAAGHLNHHAKILEPDEFGRLTFDFNQMTERLQQSTVSKHILKNIIESMLDSLLLINSEGTILQVNRITLKMFGYKMEELVGQSYKKLFLDQVVLSPDMHDRTTVCKTKTGETFSVAVTASPLNDQETNMVCVIHDMTERQRYEDSLNSTNLKLAAANKELEAFSYSVSHDLRAPLRGIDGLSKALIDDLGPKLDGETKDYLERIRAGVQRMGKLIDDMLGLSKLTRKEMKITNADLTAMSLEIFSDLKSSDPGRNVDFQISKNLKVNADPDLLRILLENLIGNAWKYTSKLSHAKIEMGVTHKDDKPCFYIKDNGAGFDMTYAQKLFGAFQRMHRDDEFPGTGVGLAIVQRIVARHGGTIRTESVVNKGTTFYFTLSQSEV